LPNDKIVGTNFPSPMNFTTRFVPYVISNNFRPGTNVLDFIVYSTPPDSGNPSELRLQISGTATLIQSPITPPSSVVISPASQTVFEGATVTFSVSNAGSAPFTYQWALNSTNISGATNAILTLTDVQPSAIGNYSITVANSAGTATSQGSAALNVVGFTATHASLAYQSPGVCVVSCQVGWALDQSLFLLVVEPALPSGWNLLSASGPGNPEVENGKISFNASTVPNPVNFTYSASVPAGQTGLKTITNNMLYFLSEMNQEASYLAEPNPLSIPYGWVITLTATNQQLSFNLYGDSGSNYVLQASPDLRSWTPVIRFVPLNGDFQTNLPVNGSKMFYRTVLGQ